MRNILKAGWDTRVSLVSGVLVRCFVVAALVGLFATQNFAQNDFNAAEPSIANSTAAHPQDFLPSASLTEANLPPITTDPMAVTTSEPATLSLPSTSAFDAPIPEQLSLVSKAFRSSDKKTESTQDQQSTNTPPSHKQGIRKGYLALGIAGAVIAAVGVIGYAERAPEPGTIFFVPGAALAGFGFFFAFHHRN